MSIEKKKEIIIEIKNNGDKLIKNVSVFNSKSNDELKYSFSSSDELGYSSYFESPKDEKQKTIMLRFQVGCEQSDNNINQLTCDFDIIKGIDVEKDSFKKYLSEDQIQSVILDVFFEGKDFILDKENDIILEFILPKTTVRLVFFI